MHNPFNENKREDETDEVLLAAIRDGDKHALERLVLRHQAWIYNIAMRMVYDPHEAEDLTQEILVKVITKLDSFQGRSNIRTWIYRIAANHIFNAGKGPIEQMIKTFSQYGDELDSIVDSDASALNANQAELELMVEEARISCIHGMLLCLERNQRLIFILGEIMKVDSQTGAEILEISADNFRQRLSRARKELYSFMNEKCGLVNKDNPCRCSRKTKGFIELGIVNPKQLLFSEGHVNKIEDITPTVLNEVDQIEEMAYVAEYQNTPFSQPQTQTDMLKTVLSSGLFDGSVH